MALTLKYVGARPYCELNIGGLTYGFARGMERDDVPEDFINTVIKPALDNGGTMWTIGGGDDTSAQQTQAMLDVVQEPEVVPEPAPVIEVAPEPEIVPEPAPEPAPVTEQTQAMLDVVEVQFSESMTRPQMMNWCRDNGIETTTSDTKVSLTAKALAHLNGDSEGDE